MDSTLEIVHSRFKKSCLIAGGFSYSQMKLQGSELPFPQANNFLVVRNKLHCKIYLQNTGYTDATCLILLVFYEVHLLTPSSWLYLYSSDGIWLLKPSCCCTLNQSNH